MATGMFQASALSSADLPIYSWSEAKLAQVEAYANRLPPAPREVVQPPGDQAAGVGHNQPPARFQDDANAVVRLGTVVTSFKWLGIAIRDPRCQRPHLRVLYNLQERLNRKTGTAFPNRRVIGEEEELEFKTVENVLYDLRRWGYIDWERRAEPELHKGRLLHYTLPVARWSEEQITEAILMWRKEREDKSPRPDGDSECPPQRVQKVPAPTGTSKKVPAPAGEKVPARTGDSNWKKELEERKGAEPPPPTPQNGGKAAMAAALGGQAAFAATSIIIHPSGKISIGEEFRAQLRETYSDSQIERGIERAPSQTGGSTDPVKLLAADPPLLLLRQAGRRDSREEACGEREGAVSAERPIRDEDSGRDPCRAGHHDQGRRPRATQDHMPEVLGAAGRRSAIRV